MSISLSEETQKLIERQMKQDGYGNADELVRDAIQFFGAGAGFDRDDIAAMEESKNQIASGQDMDWKEVSASLRKKYLSE
jgi:Arc/MetJ-type ribon-helix-helix transcriptional regulator